MTGYRFPDGRLMTINDLQYPNSLDSWQNEMYADINLANIEDYHITPAIDVNGNSPGAKDINGEDIYDGTANGRTLDHFIKYPDVNLNIRGQTSFYEYWPDPETLRTRLFTLSDGQRVSGYIHRQTFVVKGEIYEYKTAVIFDKNHPRAADNKISTFDEDEYHRLRDDMLNDPELKIDGEDVDHVLITSYDDNKVSASTMLRTKHGGLEGLRIKSDAGDNALYSITVRNSNGEKVQIIIPVEGQGRAAAASKFERVLSGEYAICADYGSCAMSTDNDFVYLGNNQDIPNLASDHNVASHSGIKPSNIKVQSNPLSNSISSKFKPDFMDESGVTWVYSGRPFFYVNKAHIDNPNVGIKIKFVVPEGLDEDMTMDLWYKVAKFGGIHVKGNDPSIHATQFVFNDIGDFEEFIKRFDENYERVNPKFLPQAGLEFTDMPDLRPQHKYEPDPKYDLMVGLWSKKGGKVSGFHNLHPNARGRMTDYFKENGFIKLVEDYWEIRKAGKTGGFIPPTLSKNSLSLDESERTVEYSSILELDSTPYVFEGKINFTWIPIEFENVGYWVDSITPADDLSDLSIDSSNAEEYFSNAMYYTLSSSIDQMISELKGVLFPNFYEDVIDVPFNSTHTESERIYHSLVDANGFSVYLILDYDMTHVWTLRNNSYVKIPIIKYGIYNPDLFLSKSEMMMDPASIQTLINNGRLPRPDFSKNTVYSYIISKLQIDS